METILIIILSSLLALTLAGVYFAFRKIYVLQEKVIEIETLLKSYKKVLLQKTIPVADDLELYQNLPGFTEQYLCTKAKHEKEGKRLFDQLTDTAKTGHYEWELRSALINLFLLSKTKDISYIKFYAIQENSKNSHNDFAKALKKLFNEEITSYNCKKSYQENFENFYATCKKLIEKESDSQITLGFLEQLYNNSDYSKA
ncbi:MAG: hypothetical protein ACK5N8_03015 [Alphaproteobacteria bacterium]